VDSIKRILPYLDDKATQEEAGSAITAIASKILQEGEAEKLAPSLVAPLQKVSQSAPDSDWAKRANGLIKKAQEKIKK
jgi:hypothetical protein